MIGSHGSTSKIPYSGGASNLDNECGLKARVKRKAKHILHIDSSSGAEEDEEYQAALDELDNSPAFNTSKFLNRTRIGNSGIKGKALGLVQEAAAAIVHPKEAIKTRATKKTAGTLAKSRPYLSRKADLDFLEAHDDLEQAEGRRDDSDDEGAFDRKNEGINQCEERIENMETARQNMRVAWITARHIQRVRVVDAIPPLPFPDDNFFEQEDDCGVLEFNWGKWIAYKLLHGSHAFSAQYIDDFQELPFDIDTLRKHVERLIIVSAPVQTLLLDIRRIYRWEKPWRTGKIMALYFILWYMSHIMTFLYGYILYSTIMNYYYPRSLEALRQGITRSLDRGATAFKVGELMDKHGSDDWLGPLMEELGAFIQVQIADLASFFEATYNFYHFRSPPATFATLCLIASLFLVSVLTDSRFALRLFWFFIGLTFFICWPISSLYPRYRFLVSPLKWALWEVPNHSEWCFRFLQDRAAVVRQAILRHEAGDIHDEQLSCVPGTGSDADSFATCRSISLDEQRDILSFGCTYCHMPGQFIISTHGIRFATSLAKSLPHESFDKPFADLVEMSKRQTRSSVLSPLAKVTTGMDKLELRFRGKGGGAGMHGMGEQEDAEIVLLENMRRRDKAFNAVVAFSGVRWQHLQQRPSKLRPEEKKGDSLTDK
ncbi:uncharacterized protein LY89DRAFT_582089 [Mollisia scopiformis]|uniref:GRAM domain-containing protein n=1 Tax=Mollisia scopiformis TaxID=149040 RepID=A0A194XEA5_MOLSC|nr:uncharacterized protein LY89DRAFT_582089 [Mollisia scopiformis]KUJ18508.1 hypothetical protein LY89DRAFT_582089 [Mollisia scopiformis]